MPAKTTVQIIPVTLTEISNTRKHRIRSYAVFSNPAVHLRVPS